MPIVVSFISQKGGVGKSTLARALLAVAGRVMTVRLADLDPHQASVIAWEKVRERNEAGPPYEVVAYKNAAEAIAASADVELLILDTPARATRDTVWIAQHSHLVVQPTGPSADDLRPAILTFHELVRAGVPKDRLVMAICRILSEDEEEATRAYIESAGYDVLDGAIAERIAYREAQNRGQAITETKSRQAQQAGGHADGRPARESDKGNQSAGSRATKEESGATMMATRGALKQLKNVWGKAGLEEAPTAEDTVGSLEPPKVGRPKSNRKAQLNLRITPDEKEQITLMAVRARVSINEIFSRMLAHYQREHGRVELKATKE